MNEIKSIWDGWEKQCFFRGSDLKGSFCARGWECQVSNNLARIGSVERRVGGWIQAHYDLPETHIHETGGHTIRPKTYPSDAIIYANNNLRLTPEDFRRIDRETQIEEALKSVERVSQQPTPDPALTPAIQRGGE